jgi:regulator of sigma E protease
MLHSVMYFLLIISIITIVHEFGHYYIARLCNVKIEEFSIGMGRELFGKYDKHGTRWKICIFPIGGYVKFYGDESVASTGVSDIKDEDKSKTLYYKNVYQRFAVVFAGPLINIIFGALIFAFIFMHIGRAKSDNIIHSIKEESFASKYGIIEGDKILQIQDRIVSNFADVKKILAIHGCNPVSIIIERKGHQIEIEIPLKKEKTKDSFGNKVSGCSIGVGANFIKEKLGFYDAMKYGIYDTIDSIETTVIVLYQLVTGQRSLSDIGGPLRIGKYSGQVAEKGYVALLEFLAIISINIGVMNLLPIPVLDGGHIVFYIIEMITLRRVSLKIQNIFYKIGGFVIISMMLLGTYNDIIFIIKNF